MLYQFFRTFYIRSAEYDGGYLDDEDKENVKLIGAYVTIPFALALPPIIGWFIGSWLDKWWNTSPYLMYVFMVLGFVAGFREVFRIVKRFGNGK